jgi:hypothetical protein
MRYLSLLLFLLPITCLAQLKVTGKVVNDVDGKPIPDASVFLNNETIGTKSADDGSFVLNNLSVGQHDLIVSVVGYEGYHQTLMISANVALPDIKLLPKTMILGEVKIGVDTKHEKKLKEFKEQFLGISVYASECEILNPEVLKLKYNRDERILTGNSDAFLEIANNALGYKLKYLIANFVMDKHENKLTYEGSVLFEEMEGSDFQLKQWKKNRRDVYFGSTMHFLREVLANRVDSNYSVESKRIISSYSSSRGFSSNRRESSDVLRPIDYVHPTEKPGIFAMGYTTNLDVFYKPRNAKGKAVKAQPQYATVSFTDPYLYFDTNGTILNPMGAIFGYAWANSRVAQLLPIDYWPEGK